VAVHRGRFTAEVDGEFVVLLIGMRVNKPWRPDKWWPVAGAMRGMLRTLDEHPELGCLGYHQWLGRTTMMVQYWRSFDALERFARDEALPHLAPWRRFNQAVGSSGDVGVWHETYRVGPGAYEAIYANMPVYGLAAAGTHQPVARRGQSAAGRIGARPDDPAVEPYQ
jgi:hypothetical protein